MDTIHLVSLRKLHTCFLFPHPSYNLITLKLCSFNHSTETRIYHYHLHHYHHRHHQLCWRPVPLNPQMLLVPSSSCVSSLTICQQWSAVAVTTFPLFNISLVDKAVCSSVPMKNVLTFTNITIIIIIIIIIISNLWNSCWRKVLIFTATIKRYPCGLQAVLHINWR